MATTTATRRLAAILAADVVAYARLTGVDEEGTLDRLKINKAETRDQFAGMVARAVPVGQGWRRVSIEWPYWGLGSGGSAYGVVTWLS
jgi:hypothetical protein